MIAHKPLLGQAIAIAAHKPAACVILQHPQAAAGTMPGQDHDWHGIASLARNIGM